jgi:hypothetical protein
MFLFLLLLVLLPLWRSNKKPGLVDLQREGGLYVSYIRIKARRILKVVW